MPAKLPSGGCFRYIQGNNEEEMKIKMTVPVTMEIQPNSAESEESFCRKNFTMSFFIPFKHQKNAPSPSADNVHLTVVKPFCAYVKVYGGYSEHQE
ncbi:Heme-binding protein 2, partial [Desmophyllum pertusum]